jgi:hypothetical protein
VLNDKLRISARMNRTDVRIAFYVSEFYCAAMNTQRSLHADNVMMSDTFVLTIYSYMLGNVKKGVIKE